jgi:hypothetical protein
MNYKLIFLTLIIIAVAVGAGIFFGEYRGSPQPAKDQVYTFYNGLTVRYPVGMNLIGDVGASTDDLASVGLTNFTFKDGEYSFPYISPLSSDQVFIQIDELAGTASSSLAQWVKDNTDATPVLVGSDKEVIRVIGENKDLKGQTMREASTTLNGMETLQRVVSYKAGEIVLLFTYLKACGRIFQVVSHSNSSRAQEVYGYILSRMTIDPERCELRQTAGVR